MLFAARHGLGRRSRRTVGDLLETWFEHARPDLSPEQLVLVESNGPVSSDVATSKVLLRRRRSTAAAPGQSSGGASREPTFDLKVECEAPGRCG